MPSEATSDAPGQTDAPSNVHAALEVMQPGTRAFRSALALSVEEVRSALRSHTVDGNGAESNEAAELGRYAAGRVDVERFSALLDQSLSLDSDAQAHVDSAFSTLSRLAERGDDLFRVDVPPGGDLRDAVAKAYEQVGRAFGAARVVQLTKSGAYDDAAHGTLLDGLPFRRWNQAERRLAPPLLITVDGGDLHVSALAEYLDGDTHLVLQVRGACPPAPLARLIAPGTYVVQADSAEGLRGLARFDGPGIGALVPEGAARFEHDPAGGRALSDRLRVEFLPDDVAPRPVGGLSSAMQSQDLNQLRALAGSAAAEAAAVGSSGEDPAGKLAAWLLRQAELPERK